MNVVPKQLQTNFNNIQNMIQQAKDDGSDMVIFPELCISGYLLGDLWYSEDFIKQCDAYNKTITKLADGIIIIWGNVTYLESLDKKGHDGRPAVYNCGFVAQDRQMVKRENDGVIPYIKHLLPNYRIFDDARYFTSGMTFDQSNMFSPFIVKIAQKEVRIGLEICEDLWSEHYDVDPTKVWASASIDLLVNISSSPWTKNKEKSRLKHIQQKAVEHAIPLFVYVNVAGMQNTGKNIVLFDGGSMCVDQDGLIVAHCEKVFEQQIMSFDSDQTETLQPKTIQLLDALIAAIREFDQQMFQKQTTWLIGLSGGIDSSVSAALLVLALGPDRVIGVNMPSKYNKQITIDNARHTAQNLKIRYVEHSIEHMVAATIQTAGIIEDDPTSQLLIENVHARVRGQLLSTLAAKYNGVIVNNGNKVETALGYCTLYGDTIGALAPLGDCTKTQIFELARNINSMFRQEIIPNNLIPTEDEKGLHFEFMPSAELREDQVDPMKWGYHDRLVEMYTEYPSYGWDDLIKRYQDKTIWDHPIAKWLTIYHLDSYEKFIEDLRWVDRMIQLSVFKRIQMPPIVLVSRGAFGTDFRENQGFFPIKG